MQPYWTSVVGEAILCKSPFNPALLVRSRRRGTADDNVDIYMMNADGSDLTRPHDPV